MRRFFLFLLPFAFSAVESPAQTPIRHLVCVNVLPQDPFIDRRTRFGMTRDFHLFRDDIESNNNNACPPASGFPQRIRWNPSRNGNKFIDFDDFYGQMPQRTVAVMHGSAPFMPGGLFGKPICSDVYNDLNKHNLPESYLLNSIRASLFAARYGTAPSGGFFSGFEQVASRYVEPPDNEMATGLGTVGHIEMFNEADNSWSESGLGNFLELYPNQTTTFYFSPRQYAALLSAAYDGNCSDPNFQIKDASGNNIQDAFWGIKNLSPGTQVVMAGTADLRKKWITDMVDWCGSMRSSCNIKLPFDVVNYHFYTTPSHPSFTDPLDQTKWNEFYNGKRTFDANVGIHPEAPNISLKDRFTFLLNDQPDELKSVPVWITEFGYSSADAGSGAGLDPATTQGQWLTRYVLETSTVRDGNGRGIDRLFIYELNNDLNTAGFTYHGLQLSDGTPKKAWYHVMTMLNVLGSYWYLRNNSSANTEQYFLTTDPTNAMPADDPRIYLYGNGSASDNNRVYALWVPFGQGKTYPGKLRLHGNWSAKPKIQKIEVLDFDEDGKRTMIPDADISWTLNNPVVEISNLTLTETPMYLRFVSGNFSDPIVPGISFLAAQCYGCQRVRLTWTAPVNAHYTFYQVYYAAVGDYPVNATTHLPEHFDLSYLHLYGDKLSGNANSIYVSLPPGEYFFWVIPYRTVYDPTLGQHVMVAPDIEANLTSFYVKFDATNCTSTPCAASLSSGNISNLSITQKDGTVLTNFGNTYYQQGFTEALIPVSTANICDEMNGSTPTYSMGAASGIQLSPNDPNSGISVSFIVNFSPPQYLNAIQMYLFGGRARVRVEFMEDCCNAFYEVKNYDFGGNTPQWVTLTNPSPKKRIDKVRITITVAEIANGGVTIGRLLFCTEPAVKRCREGGGIDEETSLISGATPPSGLEASDIDTRSAVISFQPATRTIQDELVSEPEPVYSHTLKYGIALDEQGEIVQPKEMVVHSDDYGATVQAALSQLAPNTTYIVDVLADVACNETQQTARILFSTLPEGDSERSRPTTEQRAADLPVRLSPNPASTTLHLDIPNGGYTAWRLVSLNGTLLGAGALSATDQSADLIVKDLPAGIHLVVLFGADGRYWSKGFLKIN